MWPGQRLSMRQSMFFHDSESHNFFQVLSDPTKIPHNFHIVSRDNLNGVTIPCSCPLIVQQTYFTVSIRISLIFPPLRPFFIFFFWGGGGFFFFFFFKNFKEFFIFFFFFFWGGGGSNTLYTFNKVQWFYAHVGFFSIKLVNLS